ncbi:MAG TPA: glycoside hydrolase family 99-like domain-containing protein [Roseococcus sp.]|jgi:lipopolysaccharide biosynthesis protein|nr:glycoside hydrolase family 99-like domain-containing protein [Roseococcus sp.]
MTSSDSITPISNTVSAYDGLSEIDRIAPGSAPAIFRQPARQGAISAWWGHVPFAQWLMHVARPRRVVELGTHNGVSYAAFCSSAQVEKLDCRCTAVDTWQGDHQAGRYDSRVFDALRAWHDPAYAGFSNLMRCTFDEAAPRIENGSVDLLHIDGLHTYEAVRHDLETWLPKMSRRGIVLLHDTEVRDGDFGVWRLWGEVRERYPSFGFRHSHGLGVLAVGAEAAPAVLALCALREPERVARVEALFALIGRRWSAEGELAFEWTRIAELREAVRQAEARETAAVAGMAAITGSTTWRATQSLRAILARMPWLRSTIRAAWRMAGRLAWAARRRAHRRTTGERIMQSGLFDPAYYLAANPDVEAAGMDPLSHFLSTGWRERRDPSPGFSVGGYLARYEDVRAAGVNPLLHYLQQGRREGRLAVTPAGELVHHAPRQTQAGKALDLLRAIARNPGLVLGIARKSREIGLRRAAALAWAANVPPPPVPPPAAAEPPGPEDWLLDAFGIVPYCLNPHLQQDPAVPPLRLAVHLHLYYEEMTERCIGYLRNIPARFDLFVSVPEGRDTASLSRQLAEALPEAGQVIVEAVPNRGRDIAPLIVQFGPRLLRYDAVAHFHTKKSPHKASYASWFQRIMDTLCGSRSGVTQILDLLARDAKTVYPAGNKIRLTDSGWSENRDIAAELLAAHGLEGIEDLPRVEFPQGSMFWARAASLSRLLSLPLRFEDFPEEPIPPDGTLAHALERLILVPGRSEPGRNYRLEAPGLSREGGPLFEAQHDFSGEIVHDTVKVLAYYLPQFHPTPENSAWHGEGFTEWYKVRGAYPLFQGHYQQHVPHPDLGYYHLDSPAQLHLQAEMMRKAGVHGMIFYHYWFSGRLILEKPAQMLLGAPEVAMPFCFCWANENWTRRWDGNEREILLGQDYSPEDARAFIRHLIPFFRDDRYIKVEGRPLLFVYRPSSIPDGQDYVGIWRRECEAAGLKAPYVVAVLTRGAASPADHGMDAGAERVLHDWLGSAARDIRGALRPYWPVNGSVLDYRDVANHYMRQSLPREAPLFRSLVPAWDNTARYGSEAFMVHHFSTEVMQRWMEHLVADAERHLPVDRRFVIVNAWNEWAEGAHLEPDMRFGYGYLNAIGRALSGRRFGTLDGIAVPAELVITLGFGEAGAGRLRQDVEARRKFVRCLANSGGLGGARLRVADAELAAILRAEGLNCDGAAQAEADFTLYFADLFLFPDHSIERLLQTALRFPGHSVCASPVNDPGFLHDPAAPAGQIPFPYEGRTGMELEPAAPVLGYKVCAQAPCFRMGERHEAAGDRVSTVIRYHGRGDRRLLAKALLSLLAQAGCRVRPCIGVQDMPEAEREDFLRELDRLPWAEACRPLVRFFHGTPEQPDRRSEMLNEMLRAAGPDYVGFLDYDDVLFPHAYASLLARLRLTGRNATFGRVYSTDVDGVGGLILRRDRVFDHGRTHEDFLTTNLAPVHSFLLDMRQIDATAIEYFPDMKFMEDYYLTLQVFSPDGADWDSLAQDNFIGDYIHMQGQDANTLAVSDAAKRREQLMSPEFSLSLVRINELRERLPKRG